MNQVEDVEIMLGRERRYKFHSGVLARNSTFFAKHLTEQNAVKLSKTALQSGVRIRWMFELVQLPFSDNDGGRLEPVALNNLGERTDGRSGSIFNENGRVPQAENAFNRYETILYAFYNKELTIDDTDMQAALEDCYKLVKIAEYLGCTSIIGKSIEVALLKHGQKFFLSIANAPHAWIGLAYSIHSELIFCESFIHLVGNWKKIKINPDWNNYLRQVPGLRGMTEKYHRILLARVKQLELELMSDFPQGICVPTQDLPIKREEYSKNVLVHLALMFFRHWVGNKIICDQGRHASDCGYALYRKIYAGGDMYMDKDVMNGFHTKFPMTKKAFTILENHLSTIKMKMQDIVTKSKIIDSHCQLDIVRFPVQYFTCTEFKNGDFPWLKDDAAARATPAKRVYKAGGNEIARQNLESARRFQERGQDEDDGMEDEGDEVDLEDKDGDLPPKRSRVA